MLDLLQEVGVKTGADVLVVEGGPQLLDAVKGEVTR